MTHWYFSQVEIFFNQQSLSNELLQNRFEPEKAEIYILVIITHQFSISTPKL